VRCRPRIAFKRTTTSQSDKDAPESCRQTPKAFGVNFHEPVFKNGIFRIILPLGKSENRK
jgi:hypothetical protein